MDYAQQQRNPAKHMVGISFVIVFHVILVWALVNGLARKVVEVVKGPDDKVQSIQIDIGRVLGIGTKVITVNVDRIQQLPGIKLLLSETEVRSLPDAKKQ